jgi:hypothetical protein
LPILVFETRLEFFDNNTDADGIRVGWFVWVTPSRFFVLYMFFVNMISNVLDDLYQHAKNKDGRVQNLIVEALIPITQSNCTNSACAYCSRHCCGGQIGRKYCMER